MKHFYLIWNPQREGTAAMAEQIRRYLNEHGCTCAVRGDELTAGVPENAHGRICAVFGDELAAGVPEKAHGCTCAVRGDEFVAGVPEFVRNRDAAQPAAQSVGRTETAGISRSLLMKHTDPALVPADTECVITLGGDGTLSRAARDLSSLHLPMLGVNMGNLGYLTQAGCQEPEEVAGMLDELIAGRFQLEKRMMLNGAVFRNGVVLKEATALNEILISRREMPKLLSLQLSVNGQPLCRYRADGMIIATPTGSTAYNLSAGGPIVEPSARMTILTPICPHGLNSRSIVLAAEDVIEIEILGNDDDGQLAVFDGGEAVSLKVGDRLRVQRSSMETVLVKLREISFVDHLRSKMASQGAV